MTAMSPPAGSAAHRELFDPLPRILFHDDFNRGLCGWGALIGNYEDRIDSMLPEYRDTRGPMLSNGGPPPGTGLQVLVHLVLKE